MKNIFQFFLFLTLVFLGFGFETHFVDAAGIVPCGNGDGASLDANGFISDECSLCDLQILAVRFVNFVILLATAVSALLFTNAGFLYVMSPANPGNIAKAHHLFINTLVGFVVILAAWLIVNLAMSLLLSPTFGDWKNVLCTSSVNTTTTKPIEAITSPVAAGPGYASGDFVPHPTSYGNVLSPAALTNGFNNLTNNCTVGVQTCTDYIKNQATVAGIDPNYALALAAVESGGCADPETCTSPSGAVGVIQLMPDTARDICGAACAGKTDAEMNALLKDPENNITWGVEYMKQSSSYVDTQMALHPERFDTTKKADYMAAYYNGGPTALQASNDCGSTVTKYECTINPGGYVQTQEYVDKMNAYVNSVDQGISML
jgi:hypothetical protein